MYTHQIEFGGQLYQFTSASAARAFAAAQRALFGNRMRVSRIR